MTAASKTALMTLGALLMGAPLALAGLVPGGTGKSDCYAAIDVAGIQNGTDRVQANKKALCTDGEECDTGPCGDGVCNMQVALCANQTDTNVPACVAPSGLEKLQVKGKLNIQVPQLLQGPSCGTPLGVAVATKKGGKKPGKAVFKVVAKAPKGTKPRTDKDTFQLICLPRTVACGDGGGTQCTREAPGLPAKMLLQVPDAGSDLDNGFSGDSHNFTITSQSKLNYCLTGCDATSNPVCSANGATGEGTENGPTFGAPLPLLSNGVPVCLVNRFRGGSITGTMNIQTGDMQTDVPLFADTFVRLGLTDLVCPRCDNGRCKGGKRDGQSCTPNGRANVLGSSPAEYSLSTDCLPEGQPAGTLTITLPLTTESSESLPGPKPCAAAVGQRLDDSCPSNGACTVDCSATPAAKGGINQFCCATDPNRPCHPTKSGGKIQRQGARAPLTPAWPDPTYPKTSEGSKFAGVFCEAATTDATVDNLAGLPGPGAIILPAAQTLTASQ